MELYLSGIFFFLLKKRERHSHPWGEWNTFKHVEQGSLWWLWKFFEVCRIETKQDSPLHWDCLRLGFLLWMGSTFPVNLRLSLSSRIETELSVKVNKVSILVFLQCLLELEAELRFGVQHVFSFTTRSWRRAGTQHFCYFLNIPTVIVAFHPKPSLRSSKWTIHPTSKWPQLHLTQ